MNSYWINEPLVFQEILFIMNTYNYSIVANSSLLLGQLQNLLNPSTA